MINVYYALAMLVVSAIITVAAMPKTPEPKPTAFEDLDFPQADEGTPQAVIFGDVWVDDWTVLGIGSYRTSAIKQKGGKK
jgi:hypothetical protein